MRSGQIALLLLLAVSLHWTIGSDHPHIRSIFEAIMDTSPPPPAVAKASTVEEPTICSGCTQKVVAIDDDQNKHREVKKYMVTEEELTALRIEYIKNQILRKLRLKEKPTVSMAHFPKSVTKDGTFLPLSDDDSSQEFYYDDFYGKTTQAIMLPSEDQARCMKKARYPSACLPFKLPSDVEASDLSTAELWFYKEPDAEDDHNQTFIVTEVAHWDTKKSFQKTTPIAILQTNISGGWVKVDVAEAIRNWLEYQDTPTHAINVACKTCGRDVHSQPISFKDALKPFLVIYTHSQHRKIPVRRPKRQASCVPGLNECCKESLYVSFAEIGWDDWIIHPPGYNAYFCKGSCVTAASITLSGNQHNSILQKVMYGKNRSSATRLELTPCCAATQFQPLQLLYVNNNKTILSKILSNMIVEACGCM